MTVCGNKYGGTREILLVYLKLITAAQYRGTIFYQQVAKILGIDQTGHHMAREVGQVLGEISEAEHTAGRPMLSSLAIASKGYPSKGFFTLARRLGKYSGSTPEEERLFWDQERKRVYETWADD